MWGLSLQLWETVFKSLTFAALIFGALTAVAGFGSAWLGYQLTDAVQQDANRRITEAEAKVAGAQADAERARKDTEFVKAENLRLENIIAPRRLTKDQYQDLAGLLRSYRGQKVRVESYALDAEGQAFASQVRDALRPIFSVDDWVGMEGADNGFVMGVSVTGDNSELVAAIMDALKAQGVEGVTKTPPPPPNVVGLAVSIAREKAKDVSAVVLVGIKPVKQ